MVAGARARQPTTRRLNVPMTRATQAIPDQVGMQGRSVTRNRLGRAVQDPRSTRSAGCGEVPPGGGIPALG